MQVVGVLARWHDTSSIINERKRLELIIFNAWNVSPLQETKIFAIAIVNIRYELNGVYKAKLLFIWNDNWLNVIGLYKMNILVCSKIQRIFSFCRYRNCIHIRYYNYKFPIFSNVVIAPNIPRLNFVIIVILYRFALRKGVFISRKCVSCV